MKIIPLTKGAVTIVDDDVYTRVGHLCWCLSGGYAGRCERMSDGEWKMVRLHRFIAGAKAGEVVHHKDGDKLNNKAENLEILPSHTVHAYGHNLVRAPSAGPYRGVHFHKGRQEWRAAIHINGKHKQLGVFKDDASAALAWDKEARRLFGEGCYQNFPRSAEDDPLTE